ncbi:MAG: hypothetical protein GX051_07640 [Clostridiales bacterium]|nr:hypothetical protein [Clostridiales bacterium]
MRIFKRILLVVAIILCAVIALSCTGLVPALSVIPDMVKVGIDYVNLDRDKNAVGKKELSEAISAAVSTAKHPFVLADEENFAAVRSEYKAGSAGEYAGALNTYVLANADALLNTDSFPVMEYKLDEEDSILPISREVINRIVILGYAWQVTGEAKYADRAVLELEKVCSYPDWCPTHFLATAEMAMAVSVGYDWLFDYLSEAQKDMLAQKTLDYAITPALSKNYLKNWFTWSKNNWNSICYNGIGTACMAFASYYPEQAAEFLAMCYKNMPIAFSSFTPDGVYIEGPVYSISGTNAIVNFIASSRNFFGTDFGMSEIDGFRQLGNFPVYVTAPAGVFNFGDNKDEMGFSPALHWYASEYNAPLLAAYQMQEIPAAFSADTSDNTERNSGGRENALCSLWYNRSLPTDNAVFDGEPLSVLLKSDAGQTLALMRSAYLDKNATCAAIKGGYNYTNHGDLDIGTFIFDSMGERWAEELGPGSYDAPDYFLGLPGGGRWKNYCKRAEGQNTLLINPDLKSEDQYALAKCSFSSFEETSDGGKCVLDMTDAYCMNKAKSVTREFELYNGRTCLKIKDTVECSSESEIYWFMHTKAAAEISQDGKTALLTLNGKQLRATLPDDGTFCVMPARALSGAYEYDSEYTGITKLAVHLENVKSAVITVTLEPAV